MKLLKISALFAILAISAQVAQAEGYKFKLTNTTENTMVKLLVSETGASWGPFDIGKGIPAGASATMEWSESTDDENCSQKVKAVYDDGSESEVTSFDFCEEGLELEF